MNRIIFLIFVCFFFSSQILLAKEEKYKNGSLTIVSPGPKERTEELKSIKVDHLGITISGLKGAYCFIPFEKILNVTPTGPRCEGSELKSKKQVIAEYSEIFNNAKNPNVECTFDSSYSLIGFHLTGKTILNGEPVLMAKGLMLERIGYDRDYPIKEEEEDGSGTAALKLLGKGLKFLFTPR